MEKIEKLVHSVLGGLGVAQIAYFAWLYWRVLSSPGDDNPIALVFVLALFLGAIPALGLLRWLGGAKLLSVTGVFWLIASVCVVIIAALFGLQFA